MINYLKNLFNLLLCLIFAISCKNNNNAELYSVVPPGFNIVSFSPTGLQVSLTAPISINFSRPVDMRTASALQVWSDAAPNYPYGRQPKAIAGTWTASGNNLRFIPSSNWLYGKLIIISFKEKPLAKDGTIYSGSNIVFSFLTDNGVRRGFKQIIISSIAKVANGTPEPHNLSLNLVVPQQGGPHPLLIFVHGGGWNGGTIASSTAESIPRVQYFAEHLGIASAGVSYRCLGSKGTFAKAMSDIATAIEFLKSHASGSHCMSAV